MQFLAILALRGVLFLELVCSMWIVIAITVFSKQYG